MTGAHLLRTLLGSTLLALGAAPALAQEAAGTDSPQSSNPRNQTFVDLSGGLGYSTNPLLVLGDNTGSGFARISAYGFHGWGTERSSTSLSAYVANDTYFERYGNRQVYDLGARTTRKVSETTEVYGSVGFAGDFGGQLSSRFYGAPADTIGERPPVTDNSGLLIIPDPAALNRRQYRANAQAGAGFTLSPRDTLGVSVGAQRIWFSGNDNTLDFNVYDASAAYGRKLNERASVGVRVTTTYAEYALGRSILSYGPQLIGDLQLSENLQLRGGIGFVRTERDLGTLGGKDSSIDLAVDGSLCRSLEYERFCAGVARRTQSSVIGAAPTSTSLNLDYSRRLSARDQFQASFSLVTTDETLDANIGRQTFYSLAGSYDRRINTRMSAGVSLVARRLNAAGPDPKNDVGANVYIRNRFGSIL